MLSHTLRIGTKSWVNPSVIASTKTFAHPSSLVSHQLIGKCLDDALVAARGEEYMERKWLKDLFAAPGMKCRHMIWHPSLVAYASPSQFPNTDGDGPMESDAYIRTRSFVEAGRMLRVASDKALSDAQISIEDVERLIVSDELVYPTAIDEQTHFGDAFTKARRMHLTGLGCVSGLVAIRDSVDYLKGHSSSAVQTGTVEVLSRGWAFPGIAYLLRAMDAGDKDAMRTDIVASLLLGDLAGSSVLFGSSHAKFKEAAFEKGGFVVVDSERYNLPLHRSVMGYERIVTSTHEEWGPRAIITKDIPKISVPIVLELIRTLLKRNNVEIGRVRSILAHPGGKKILDMIAQELGGVEQHSPRMASSYHTLENYGNCAGATIYQVMARELEVRPVGVLDPKDGPEPVVLVGMGMGMTFEAMLAFRFPSGGLGGMMDD